MLTGKKKLIKMFCMECNNPRDSGWSKFHNFNIVQIFGKGCEG